MYADAADGEAEAAAHVWRFLHHLVLAGHQEGLLHVPAGSSSGVRAENEVGLEYLCARQLRRAALSSNVGEVMALRLSAKIQEGRAAYRTAAGVVVVGLVAAARRKPQAWAAARPSAC